MSNLTIPEGFKRNARGHLIPVEQVKPIDIARDELIAEIIGRAHQVSNTLSEFKQRTFGDVAAFVELSAERYDVKLGGIKGNVRLISFDGCRRVDRAIADTMVFDEGLQAAKALIDECLHDWTANARTEVRAIIDSAFQVDKEGNLDTGRILTLRRLDITDERWLRAMTALNDSLQVQCSTSYIRIYERDDIGQKWRPVSLDLAGV